MNTNKTAHIVVYPDPIIDINMLSAAMFLFFDESIVLTLPPIVIENDSYKLLSIINERKPEWSNCFNNIFKTWRLQVECWENVMDILSPLKGEKLKTVWTVYPADFEAINKSQELIESSCLSFDTIYQMLNPINASGELIRHIMLEAFLAYDKYVNRLFEYCEALFKKEPIDNLLAKSYLLRLPILNLLARDSSILITNYSVWNQLLTGTITTVNGDYLQS